MARRLYYCHPNEYVGNGLSRYLTCHVKNSLLPPYQAFFVLHHLSSENNLSFLSFSFAITHSSLLIIQSSPPKNKNAKQTIRVSVIITITLSYHTKTCFTCNRWSWWMQNILHQYQALVANLWGNLITTYRYRIEENHRFRVSLQQHFLW